MLTLKLRSQVRSLSGAKIFFLILHFFGFAHSMVLVEHNKKCFVFRRLKNIPGELEFLVRHLINIRSLTESKHEFESFI